MNTPFQKKVHKQVEKAIVEVEKVLAIDGSIFEHQSLPSGLVQSLLVAHNHLVGAKIRLEGNQDDEEYLVTRPKIDYAGRRPIR